jgi:MoxR-like ATPase
MSILPQRSAGMSAKELVEKGVGPMLPGEVLRRHILGVLKQAKGLQELFPSTILPDETLEAVVSALLARGHVLLFGPSGSGKTNLAKDIWNLFPKDALAVDGCPLQDSPFSLVDANFARQLPPCPFCRSRFAEQGADEFGEFRVENVDPSKVPVARVRLREGFGFSRIQGSNEVFPDFLTGNINLHKLEEIGDPESPLVLEPGKLLQANRGLCIIDEIGKLPLGTQNVLLQSLQEGIVTPAKSRETFPARLIAVCTSNLADLDNINEPLNDRLISIHVPFNREHARNRRIVTMAYRPEVFMPEPFVDGAVGIIERWREVAGDNPDLTEVGSNRSMIDLILRTEAYALLAGRRYPSLGDFRNGVRDAMHGRVRARGGDSFEHNSKVIDAFLEKGIEQELKEWARGCWCSFYKSIGEKRDVGEKVVRQFRRIKDDPTMVPKVGANFPEFALFVSWAEKRYSGDINDSLYLFSVLEDADVFGGEKLQVECK